MKIICVGRNYVAHAKELGNEVPGEPVIFLKPDSALLRNNDDFFIPEYSKDVHHECELVFRVSKEGKYVNKRFAASYVDAVALGIDFTARDLQSKAKEKGLPWTLSKGFHGSAPVSQFIPLSELPPPGNLHFELKVNGETRQRGDTSLVLWDIASLIEFITKYMVIKKGDLIFTGTPEGVAKVNAGDHLQGSLEGKLLLDFHVR